jgi:hypothetical protein
MNAKETLEQLLGHLGFEAAVKELVVEGPTFKLAHKPLKNVEEKLLKFELARTNLEKKA